MKDPHQHDAPDRKPDGQRSTAAGGVAQFGGLGLQFAAAMALFTYAGYRLDRWLGTDPWLTVVLALVGAGAAFYFVYRKVFPRTPPEGR